MTLTWPQILTSLISGENLGLDKARWAMTEIMTGNASDVQIAAFAVALRVKGETVEELAGLADAMLRHATPLELPREAVDVVGSGGDRAGTVNISTMAAIVAAAAGAPVVKHGNRAASSQCGTADVLEALGVVLDLAPDKQPALFAETGITFLFAPLYHPALRYAAGPRRQLGVQTSFNFLGPLANPARPLANAVGVADPAMAALVAGVMAERGARGLVFHGGDGLDELTTTTDSQVWIVSEGRVSEQSLDPAAVGIAPATMADLVGGDPAHNAEVVRQVLSGQPGPIRDIVILNAAATLLAYDGPGHDEDLADQFLPQLHRAAAAIDSASAMTKLTDWIKATQLAR